MGPMGPIGSERPDAMDELLAECRRINVICHDKMTFRELALMACRCMAAAAEHRPERETLRDVLGVKRELAAEMDIERVRATLREHAGLYADLALAAYEKGL